ncbi:MAG: aminoacetone oxidase family FAD-binding enzyme, partial [Clostridiales bacterium]|nr:aminoacetone oxidase family FAD-binding enzyme [Candidatus Blautia equi]
HQMMDFMEQSGVPLKVERGNRVFPESDHSSDVIRALERRMKRAGVNIHLNTGVRSLWTEDDHIYGVQLMDGKRYPFDQVLVATGGFSYQTTGSTGDGYRFAEATRHKVTELNPSLVPLLTKEDYIPKMAGLSLKNTGLTIKNGKKTLYQDFGEMLFTHVGVSGPMILSASAHWGKNWKAEELQAYLDLKPALTLEQLDARILKEFEAGQNKQFKNVISVLFPSSLTPVIVELSGISPDKLVHEITREERRHFAELTKAFPFTIVGRGEFKEAIITKGGVSVKDVSPNTMESKLVSGLYFIGEVLDLDAVTGGYNLQIAWSTAYLAAQSINEMAE